MTLSPQDLPELDLLSDEAEAGCRVLQHFLLGQRATMDEVLSGAAEAEHEVQGASAPRCGGLTKQAPQHRTKADVANHREQLAVVQLLFLGLLLDVIELDVLLL